MIPKIGDKVIYQESSKRSYNAIITRVKDNQTVDLKIIKDDSGGLVRCFNTPFKKEKVNGNCYV